MRRAASLLIGITLVVLTAARVGPGASAAAAAVQRVVGFRATVDGFTSWYGAYGMDAIGIAWCIDHGSRAPDPALAYVPTGAAEHPPEVRQAAAWALGRVGSSPSSVDAAALMLVLHDLFGARYPSGDLDVDSLGPERLAGFGSQAAAVVARARELKADAVAHRSVVAPYRLELSAPASAPTGSARVVDANGAPVAGIAIAVDGTAVAGGRAEPTTDAAGTVAFALAPPVGASNVHAVTTIPDTRLQAFAPTSARAQRVARPAIVVVEATADVLVAPPALPPSTTTTTTHPPATTTTTIATTTTNPTTSTTTTTTTAPPALPAAAPAPSPPEQPPIPVVAVPASSLPTLPRTGSSIGGLVSLGSGLVLLGAAVRPGRRPDSA